MSVEGDFMYATVAVCLTQFFFVQKNGKLTIKDPYYGPVEDHWLKTQNLVFIIPISFLFETVGIKNRSFHLSNCRFTR